MGNRQVVILAGVLGVLLILAYFSGVFGDPPSTVRVPAWDIKASEVSSVQVAGETGTVVRAQKDGEIWRVTDPVDAPGDTEALDRFLEQLEALTPQRIVTSNQSQYGTYGVDSAATTITIDVAGKSRSIVLGNPGREFATRFARIGSEKHVVSIVGGLAIPSSADDWRDRTLLAFQPNRIKSIRILSPDESYSVERNGSIWRFSDSRVPTDSLETTRWVERLANLRSDGFLPDSLFGTVADSTTHRLDVISENGSVETVTFWQRANNVAATRSGGNEVHRILLSSMGTIFRAKSTLEN